MRIRVLTAPISEGSVVLAAGAVLAALLAGIAAATSHGELVVGGAIALAFFAAAALVFARDPVLAFIWLWVLVIFNSPLSVAFGNHSSAGTAVRQGDEVLVLFFLTMAVWRVARTGAQWPPLRFVLPGVMVAACGLLGAVVHSVPLVVAVLGAWLGLKFWVMIGIALLLPWSADDFRRVYSALTGVGIFVALIGIMDYFTHGAVSSALNAPTSHIGTEGFRGAAVRSIFPQPGEFSLFMSLLFALAFARFAVTRRRSDLLLALLFAGSILLSLRLKGFLALGAVTAVVALVQAMENHRGAISVVLVGGLLLACVFAVEQNVITRQVSTYTSSETARAKLYATGERIGAGDFPLGAGFGRFGSYTSLLFYSPVYYQYGLSNTYGLSQAYPEFIQDTSWPSVVGETGYGGLVAYLTGIVIIVLALIRLIRANTATKWVPLAALCAVAALLVDSLGDPTLFDWIATVTFALIAGPALAAVRRQPIGNVSTAIRGHAIARRATDRRASTGEDGASRKLQPTWGVVMHRSK